MATGVLQTPQNEIYVRMLMNGPRLTMHLSWVFLVLQQWDQKESNQCTWQLHALSRAVSISTSVAFVKEKIGASIEDSFPALLGKDLSCASAYLELEEQTSRGRPMESAERWLTRLAWPVGKETARYLWESSEIFFEAGRLDPARQIWTRLSKEDYKAFPEYTYAGIRLDPNRTELESLWGPK